MLKRTNPLLFLILFLAACSGGSNCPINTPSCCTNVLFGCGTFDLPFGCQCSDYGFFVGSSDVKISSARASSANDKEIGGVWAGVLEQQSNSCSGLLEKVKGSVKVRRSGKLVTVSVAHAGSLRGRTNNTGFSASGNYSPYTGCSASTRVKFSRAKAGAAKIQAALNFRCTNLPSCAAVYSGTLQKQLR